MLTRYEYDIWGNCTVAYDPEGIGAINPFRYRGYYYDTESGLYYLMSRYYDPSIGQFISPDTMQALQPNVIGGVDLYAYCRNNPVMGYDPTGHWDWGKFWTGLSIVGATVAAIAITVGTLGTGSVAGTILIAGAIGASAELFSQTVINEKNLAEVNYAQVAIAAIGGAISAIPGIKLVGSMIIGATTSALVTAAGGGSLCEVGASFVIGGAGAALGYGAGKLISHFGAKFKVNEMSKMSGAEMKRLMRPFFKGNEINSAKHLSYVLSKMPDLPYTLFGTAFSQMGNSSISASFGIGAALLTNKWLFR